MSSLSISLFSEQEIITEVADDTYFYYEDEYFDKNQVKINEINKIIVDNNEIIAKQDLNKENFPDGFSNRESKIIDIAFVLPSFTMAAYDDSFYNFFRSHSDIQAGQYVSVDIHLLSSQVPSGIDAMNNHKSIALHKIRDHLSFLLPSSNFNDLDDKMVDEGLIFEANGANIYDIIILVHQEYVTQEEYSNFKKFVENGGIMILLDSNTFYAEVDYDNMNNQINLVKGHYWAFDGQKEWRDIKRKMGTRDYRMGRE